MLTAASIRSMSVKGDVKSKFYTKNEYYKTPASYSQNENKNKQMTPEEMKKLLYFGYLRTIRIG